MFDDVLLNKRESVLRCLKLIREYYQGNPDRLSEFMVQDAIILNLQRACELSIDIANYLVGRDDLGIPKESRESFQILEREKIISREVSDMMKKMVGFRNRAIHEYSALDISLLKTIIETHLEDFEKYICEVLEYDKKKC